MKIFKIVHCHDQNTAVGVTGNESTLVTVLRDTTKPTDRVFVDFADDPTDATVKERDLWYCICNIDFGIISRAGGTVDPNCPNGRPPLPCFRDGRKNWRGGYTHLRVLVFHVNNVAAKVRPQLVRKKLRQMLMDCVRFQVDVLGGDANGAMYQYFP